MGMSSHHNDVPWCVIGPVKIMYHASIDVTTTVTYDDRGVFGSHGAYAVWTGTAPRSVNVSSNMVAANADELAFNMAQVEAAYNWTQGNPPKCESLQAPASSVFDMDVMIESYSSSIEEGTHIQAGTPIQIALSLSLKECKPI